MKMSSKFVKFNDKHVGSVNIKTVMKSLPETVTENTLKQVDEWRSSTLAKIADESIDYARKTFNVSKERPTITVNDFSLGGECVNNIVIDSSAKTIIETTYKHNELMKAVIERSETLYNEFNMEVPDSEENSQAVF